MMQLFYHLGSCSLASHIALHEAGADYKAVRVSMAGGGQKTPEYLASTDPWAFAQVQAFTMSDGYLFTPADWLELTASIRPASRRSTPTVSACAPGRRSARCWPRRRADKKREGAPGTRPPG